ncbi:BamA/TamA family outer membrane protein [uncultured Bacteroides sp.]|uniref:translocation and assembly module lipoprotein TamL n=1 Tax=uncultured Bacteroides sp. TaxID=162156 RepID=UPI002AAACD68|nr:BamA/TamA family outer membrane protein [uncultured Bacteroides sp.]
MKRNSQIYIFSVALLALASCSLTKYVPNGSYLLDEVKIVSAQQEVKPAPFRNYVRQNPNSKWFSLIKVPLYTYNLSGRDTSKWINRMWRRLGDEPVIYDEALDLRSQQEIKKALNNQGYMSASVKSKKEISKKKLKLTYTITPGKPYIIRNLKLDIRDRVIGAILEKDSSRTKLNKGMMFDINTLDAERQRIVELLVNRGYYKFNKEYITYTADTVRNTYQADLTMHLLLYKASPTDEPKNHNQYRINKVSFITDYDILQSSALSSIEINDSIHYKEYPIYYKDKLYLRPNVLANNTFIRPGHLYAERSVQNTYSSFGRLSALKYTNIRFLETQVADSAKLDCYVLLTKSKHKSVAFELEGTNSAGDLGAAASVSFQHRNLFKGSESLMIKLRGAYEAISGLQGAYGNNDNYTEYGAETSINFPVFLFPLLSDNFTRGIRATTEFGLQYSYQLRPEFSRTIASTSWSYKWTQRRQKVQHRIDLLDISYIYLPWISQKFKDDYLNNANSIFKYNYDNHLIVRSGYSYYYNSIGGTILNNTAASNSYSVRVNFESAGNVLYGISKLINQQKTSNGDYSILNIAYAQYLKGDFDFAKNIEMDKRNSFAFHAAFGAAYPYGNTTVLPLEKRYFSGGANSVRGWSVRSLGPGSYKGDNNTINYLTQSGDIKLDLSVEYRSKLFWKLQGAAFVDAGNIWTIRNYENQPGGAFRLNSFYKEIAFAYGLGLRFDFDYFVLRFDGGMKAINPAYPSGKEHYPILNPDFSRDFAFHFAVGYPF